MSKLFPYQRVFYILGGIRVSAK